MAQQLTEILSFFLDNYIPGKNQTFGKNASVYNSICNLAPQKIYETNLVDRKEYKVAGSVGQGNWAKVPWLAIFRNGIAENATEGVYIVYLLSSDGNSLYLKIYHLNSTIEIFCQMKIFLLETTSLVLEKCMKRGRFFIRNIRN